MQAVFWIIKSTQSIVTISSIKLIEEIRGDPPWLMPRQFKTLIIKHFQIESLCIGENLLVKKMRSHLVDATINVITYGSIPKEWSCTFYGTFNELIARSIHRNELTRMSL